jgi:hypothetical protein
MRDPNQLNYRILGLPAEAGDVYLDKNITTQILGQVRNNFAEQTDLAYPYNDYGGPDGEATVQAIQAFVEDFNHRLFDGRFEGISPFLKLQYVPNPPEYTGEQGTAAFVAGLGVFIGRCLMVITSSQPTSRYNQIRAPPETGMA